MGWFFVVDIKGICGFCQMQNNQHITNTSRIAEVKISIFNLQNERMNVYEIAE